MQNPKDKREIILDSRMRKVFGVDSFTMFRYVYGHVDEFVPNARADK